LRGSVIFAEYIDKSLLARFSLPTVYIIHTTQIILVTMTEFNKYVTQTYTSKKLQAKSA